MSRSPSCGLVYVFVLEKQAANVLFWLGMRSIIKVDIGSWEAGKLGWFRSSSFGWGVGVDGERWEGWVVVVWGKEG